MGTHAQISFYKKISGVGHDYGEGIVQLPDSSYMVCGSSTSFTEGAPQAYIMKLDSLGNHLWSKDYGGLETESAKRIFHTPNEGFYLAGHTNTTTTGDFDFYFLHTDLDGELIWEKHYGTDSWDILTDAIKLADSSYVLVGETFNPLDGEKDGYIIRLDKFGDTLWTKSSGVLDEDIFNDVQNFYDTSFVVGGKVWNADSSHYKAYLACYYLDGTLIWENEYGLDGSYEVKSMALDDEFVVAVGNRISETDGLPDEYLLIVFGDDQGLQFYDDYIPFVGARSFDFITAYGEPNDYYCVLANDDQFTSGPGQDLYIGDYNQIVTFQNSGVDIDGSYDDIIGQMVPTSDSGAVAVGTNNNIVLQVPNVFVLKIGKDQMYPVTFPYPSTTNILHVFENQLNQISTSIYPNPAVTELKIELLNDNQKGEVVLVDFTGKIVKTVSAEANPSTVDVTDVNTGMYILRFITESGEVKTLGKISVK